MENKGDSMTQPVGVVNNIVERPVSAEIGKERFTLIFRSQRAAEVFDGLFQALMKADEILGSHCKHFVPEPFKSWAEYAAELGTPQVLAYEVSFDDQFSSDDLSKKAASIFRAARK